MMAEEDRITMSQKESNRLYVIRQAMDKAITQEQAAALLDITARQVRRIVRSVRKEGDAGICHRSRGKRAHNRIPDRIKDKATALCRDRYREFGPTHASEKLLKVHHMTVSDETLRGWFQQEHIPYRSRKKRPHRQWRTRKAHRGEMVQMDGSHHDWFEGRGPACVLMGYIDDATGRVYARFYEYEGTLPAMDSFKRYIRLYGLPRSVYLDRHTTYKSMARQTVAEELNDIRPMSHFEKSMAELGVEVIHAYSPQAKGRIERLFGTFQDRVVKEMRLAGVTNIGEGNTFLDGYLPEYNRRFAKEAAKRANYHRPIVNKRALDTILSIRTERALRNDFTITHNKKLYQIKSNIRAKKIIVQERTDGSMRVLHNGLRLKFKEIEARPLKEKLPAKRPRLIRAHTQPVTHPWKSPARALIKARMQRQAISQNRTF
ncbi:MAG TPA: ISNCY family transposase [Nitrospiraceae bacterium]|nr:ISNCY family transposase [Nitrospiraceae bacterium]